MALEEEFKLEIPDKEADKIDSCNLAIEYIHNHPLASWFEHVVSLPEFRGRQWHFVLFVFLVQCLYGFDPHAGIGNNLSLFDKSSIGRTAIWLHYASSTKWSLVSICEEVLSGTKFLFTFRMLQFPAAAFVHGFHCVVHCYFGGYLSLARDFSDACILFSRSACFTLCFLVCVSSSVGLGVHCSHVAALIACHWYLSLWTLSSFHFLVWLGYKDWSRGALFLRRNSLKT